MIGITFLQSRSNKEPASSGITTMAVCSVHFKNSIQNTNGIHFDSHRFLEDIGKQLAPRSSCTVGSRGGFEDTRSRNSEIGINLLQTICCSFNVQRKGYLEQSQGC